LHDQSVLPVQTAHKAYQRSNEPSYPSAVTMLSGNPTTVVSFSASTSTTSASSNNNTRPDWAGLASTPVTHVNRFAVLDTIADDEVQDNDQNEHFTTVRSKRHKRAREHSSPTQAAAAEAPSGIAVRQRRGPLVLGKSSSASVVVAANKLRKRKSIFCVDNVNTSCTAEDMISFITAMAIEVVSCFEVKPRRRRNDSASSVNRKAFRIGIYSDDVDRFLNADMWPDSITISPPADTDNSNSSSSRNVSTSVELLDTQHNQRQQASLQQVAQQLLLKLQMVHLSVRTMMKRS